MCPGSRNAPFLQAFERDSNFTCHSLVDERSAAYVALGMILKLSAPVVIVTTSGTAALNLAPAVAEANMQNLPLLVLTADRPEEFPSQFTNQRINQKNLYSGNARGFLQVDEPESTKDLQMQAQRINDFLVTLHSERPGPLHINFLFNEPLYEALPARVSEIAFKLKPSEQNSETGVIPAEEVEKITDFISKQSRILILAGMGNYTREMKGWLGQMSRQSQTAVFAENLANLGGSEFIITPELALGGANDEELYDLQPDMVLCIGGQIVSKRARLYIQGMNNTSVLSYENLSVKDLLKLKDKLSEETKKYKAPCNNAYQKAWKVIESRAITVAADYLEQAEYSNVYVMKKVIDKARPGTHVHLGSSGSIRYSQLLTTREDLNYQSNRGTSGIDGCLSTAVGAAMVSEKEHLAILGDLSFAYDSNALWNRNFPGNLNIVVLNDKGGGIFRIIDGPERMSFFEEYSVAYHRVSIEHLVHVFGLHYIYASSERELDSALNKIFKSRVKPTVIEVDTATAENSTIFKNFYKTIKKQ